MQDQHEVQLTQPFKIQITPVTQLQWTLLMAENPFRFKTNGATVKINRKNILLNANRPVENISWNDVQKFLEKINQLDPQYHYRLPTEAEWEYATRPAGETAYSYANDPNELDFYRWYSSNAKNQPQDVASLNPTLNGIYDFHGNVWEWVQDWHSTGGPSFSVDPRGPSTGSLRVIREGSWIGGAAQLRSSKRGAQRSDSSDSFTGFRLVRTSK